MDLRSAVSLVSVVALVGALAASSMRDLAMREIPNWCVALVAAARVPVATSAAEPAADVAGVLLGAGCVLVFLLCVQVLARKAFGSAGIGAGDVKLWAALGLWTGPVGGLAVVGASCVIALAAHAVSLGLRSARTRFCPRLDHGIQAPQAARAGTMPMAPSIAAATALVFLCGLG